MSLCIDSIEDVLGEKNLCVQSRLAFALFLCSSVELRWLSNLVLQFLVFGQQSSIFFLFLSQLMFFVQQIGLESVLFKLENVLDLFDLLVFNGFQFNSHLLSDLDSLSSCNVGILQDVDIRNSL